MEDINSKTAQAGDKVDFIADDNVYVGEALVLPKGARGNATIKKWYSPASLAAMPALTSTFPL